MAYSSNGLKTFLRNERKPAEYHPKDLDSKQSVDNEPMFY